MKDEIKEILDELESMFEISELEEQINNINKIKNHITNLQEKLEVSQTNEETNRLEMQDITKILGLDEHTTFDEVKEYANNLQERNNNLKEDFKRHIDRINELTERSDNLQEENERLKEIVENLTTMTVCGDKKQIKNTAQYKLDIYKQRNEKAIEYTKRFINGKTSRIDEFKNVELVLETIVQLLQGEDNEE